MEAPHRTDVTTVAGFAVGVGLVFVATLGVYWRFWQAGAGVWIWGLGSFAVGAVLGGAFAVLRKAKP